MTDKPDKTPSVSLNKPPADAATAQRPRPVLYAVIAMGVSAVASLIASVVLYGQSGWLKHEQAKSNSSAIKSAISSASASATSASHSVAPAVSSASASATKKYPTEGPSLHHLVTQQQSGALIGSIILVVAMAMLAVGVYRGRHWSRWAVVAFWFLATFTGTFAGITYIFAIGGSLPAAFKTPLFVSATALLVAVILVNLRPSTEYFALSRPVRAAGAPPRRGLFGAPRPAPADRPGSGGGARKAVAKTLTSSAATRGETYVQKQRSKKRAAANAESIARGAELARNRAKASKSRKLES